MIREMLHKMKPVVVILGATGTGKSKLAIELACKFNGEIISADSMQVYQGLDIITNKVTQHERSLCPHHMIDFVSPLKLNYTVTDFKTASLQIMEDIWHRNRLPIVVGGTNYYIESLLWDFILETRESHISSSSDDESSVDRDTVNETGSIGRNGDNNYCLPCFDTDETVPTCDLYERLKHIDPSSATDIHPKDRRKIQRALQVFRQTGLRRSELLERQHLKSGDSVGAVSGALKHTDTTMIWIQCEQDVLNDRLNKRVDDMISAGLVSEMLEFHRQYNEQQELNRHCRDYTLGIFQTIGFKEFHRYLMLTDNERKTEHGCQLFQQGVDEMKQATRKYARRQLKWIIGRFQKRKAVDVPPVYVVDATVETDWEIKVLLPAIEVVSAFQQHRTPALEPLKREQDGNDRLFKECLYCNVTAISRTNWDAHISGRRHKKCFASRRKAERDLLNTLTVYESQCASTEIELQLCPDSGATSDANNSMNICTDNLALNG